MKKLILAAIAVTCAVSVFAQGTVTFNNNVSGTIRTHVYAPLATDTAFSQLGQGSNDQGPAGTTVWSSFTLIGASGITAQYGAQYTLGQLLGAQGNNATESQLLLGNNTTSFRTGAGAGYVSGTTTTFTTLTGDAAGTVEFVAWDDSSGAYANWTSAYAAWTKGWIAAGESGRFNVVLGGTGTPPFLTGAESFNLYYQVTPEPSMFALAGLGLASLLVLRRRK